MIVYMLNFLVIDAPMIYVIEAPTEDVAAYMYVDTDVYDNTDRPVAPIFGVEAEN